MLSPALATQLETVISIPVTPFQPEDVWQVEWDLYRQNIARQVAGGITALTPNGNTSEFFSLTEAEVAQACREALDVAGPDVLIMPGVGHDVQTASRMAQQAVAYGAQAVMIHQPVHPFLGNDGWVEYHCEIARYIPDTGFTCYLRDPKITAQDLVDLAEACPNLIGIKYAVPNVVAFAEVARQLAPYPLALICGVAETWAPFFWNAGATGFTSGLVNVTTEPSLALLEALNRGDMAEAMDIWHRIRPFEALRARNQNALNVSVVKEAMEQAGLASRTVRPPLGPVPEADREFLAQALQHFSLPALPVL